MESFLWAAHHLIDANGNQILDASAITTLHNAAVAACDGTDGLVDGQLSDPRLCHWNPATIQCSATLTSNCLTPGQVAAAQAMYQGPKDAQGDYLWPGGEAYGSEPAWPSFAGAGEALGGSFEKYMAFERDLPASWTWRDFQFDRPTWEAMNDMSGVYNSNNGNNPDLSAFARAGGKLLAWQSWDDEAGGPYSVLDWYAQVEDRAGGLAATQQFARVFMTPGGSHGQTAAGVPYTLPVLANLVTWVETGQAPEEIDATSPTRTYPVFAYPARAKYTGSGDPNVASSWVESIPSPLPDDHFAWLGDPRGHGKR
jgi:feruloyl esterase